MEKTIDYIRQISTSRFFHNGYFIVTGSNIIRPGENYRATVFFNGYKNEEKLQIRLRPINEKKDDYEYTKVKLLGNDSTVVELDANNGMGGEYYLEVKCGDRFKETRHILVNSKKFSIFVQTDKSVYKPADNIQFRVLILDVETRPVDPQDVEIFFTDGGENRVKQIDNPKFKKGVFQGQFQLSDLPVMGNWKIHVKVDNSEVFTKIFEVNEYVLPKFEVTIDSNPNIHYKYGKIRASVKAKYTFGKVASGSAVVSAKVEKLNSKSSRTVDSSKGCTKQISVDGKGSVEFDLEKDLKIFDNNVERVVTLDVKFKEALTEKEVSGSTEVFVHKTPYKLELKRSSEKFKPGLPYFIKAIVKNHERGTPVNDSFNPVKFVITEYINVKKTFRESFEAMVDGKRLRPNQEYEAWEEQTRIRDMEIYLENGIAKLDIDLEPKVFKFNIKAKYQDTEQSITNILKVETESNQYIMARVITENPTLDKIVQAEVVSTDEISQLSYQVLGRGNCLLSKTLHFPNTKRYVISFKPTLMMIPKAQLVINYITSDGEIISERIEVVFGNELVNNIELNLASEQVSPGADMHLSVKTKPNSFVNLLGVDQSVLLLKKGNDIDPSSVFDELLKYGKIDNLTNFHGGYNDFKAADAIVITNAKKPYVPKFTRRAYNYSFNDYAFTSSTGPRRMFSRMRSSEDDGEFCLRNISRRPETKKKSFEDDEEELMVEDDMIEPEPKKEIEIRKDFPETWMFDSLDFANDEDTKMIIKKVPDTITSWVITAFSINPVTGLGLTKQPSKFNVFQPFFVSTNLPYSIKRGEVVAIPIIVFNYMDKDQMSDIIFYNEDSEFAFIDSEDDEDLMSTERKRTKSVFVKANEGATVTFMIKPLKVGNITIKVTAETPLAGDGVERLLKVEPEGLPQFLNEAIFIDLRQNEVFAKAFEIDIPKNAVPDSTRIEVSAIADILGPSIDNLDKLIKLPYGCGEQNMLNFVPNIVVLDYLTSVNKLTPAIEQKTKNFMETGYQRELTYKRSDGSYSAFGKSDRSGSTWLTAFVARSFNQASKYIRIERHIIKHALDFLSNVQESNGSFKEVGRVFQKDMQGGASKGIGLTAYTLITFVENEYFRENFKHTISKAIEYIVKHKDELNDTYSLAIATYAMQLANHELKDSLMKKLEERAINENNLKYWTKPIPESEEKNPWYYRPMPVNVEMSAYALQAFVEAGRVLDGVSIMKWLVTQRNANGGFQSTQDTVVGLQALAKLASKIHTVKNDVHICVKSKSSPDTMINVNTSNALILQKFELSSQDREFELSAKGNGFCVFQISYRYNLDDAGKYPRFNLNPMVQKNSTKEYLNLTVSASFVPDETSEKSNMAVMEVTLPSGFTFDSDHLATLLKSDRVKKVETKNSDTVVVVYFDDLDKQELRPTIKAYRTHKVAKQKPAPVVIYDYYDSTRRATTFYSPPEISISDISVDA